MASTRVLATFGLAWCALSACGVSNGRSQTSSPNNTALTPATHDKFPIASGPHAVDCNVCHGAYATFAQFSCLNGCHAQATTDSGHTNVPGYNYSSPACYSCHPTGIGGAPLYITVGGFPIPQPPAAMATTQAGIANLPHPTVGTQSCVTCHTTAAGGKNATGYDHASNLINSNCGSCHEAGSDLVGTLWNNVTAESAGAGDTRPFTLASVNAHSDQRSVPYPNHFYPADCHECHPTPSGVSKVSTGSAYLGGNGWTFNHDTQKMTHDSTCLMCHPGGVPN